MGDRDERYFEELPIEDKKLIRTLNKANHAVDEGDGVWFIKPSSPVVPPLTFGNLIQTDNHVFKEVNPHQPWEYDYNVSLDINQYYLDDFGFKRNDIRRILITHPLSNQKSFYINYDDLFDNQMFGGSELLLFGLDSYFNISPFVEKGFDAHLLINRNRYMKMRIPPIETDYTKGRFMLKTK